MSSDLVWLLTRSNTSFLVKRNGVQLSREAGNVFNKNSKKFSGLAAENTVSITAGSKGVVVSLKNTKVSLSKPAASKIEISLVKSAKKSTKSVRNLLKSYRPDLTDAAVKRVERLYAAQKPLKPIKQKKVRGVEKK